MRRLIRGRRGRWSVPSPMARLRSEERGGVAVMLALLMPLLFGAAAIGIDSAAVWSARQQVLSGADAAVLAVATDCARNECGNIKKTAEDAFWANDLAAKLSNLGAGEGWIKVSGRNISVTQKMPWEVNHFFAGALGHDTGQLSVSSYAQWAPLTRARSELPIAIGYCSYRALALPLAAEKTVSLGVGETSGGNCSTPTGTSASAGIAFTESDGSCRTSTVWKGTYTRESPVLQGPLPDGCTDAYFASMVGRDVVIPVWDTQQGQNYRVYGYAAFRVTGWDGSGARKLTGHFTYLARQVDDTTPPDTTAPDLGARAVFLTKN
ncbi:Flp pilus assembly protein TadG [Blastococcus aggregatus]|uniref:Flp pilus assembly protein TadG n=1 Tax=Blastococcus aggregatus TaxID=38502 RepID=A0A285VA21_9ACTN|nr:TadE/TadG family type IV pilus assembly protein [Blastococcus aggregatus]SOC50863.1 Flp pilus assembly protein TadG [Blastococcus aggregatus]